MTIESILPDVRDKVFSWAAARFPDSSELRLTVQHHPEPERILVLTLDGDGLEGKIQLLLKRTHRNEPRAYEALSQVSLPAGRVPEFVASGRDPHLSDGGSFSATDWIVYLAVPGTRPARDAASDVVFDTLARVHAHYYDNVEALGELHRLDLAQWRNLCGEVAAKLDAKSTEHPDARIKWMRDEVHQWAEDPAMHEAIRVLPRTLLHGDLNYSNIVGRGDVQTIIDWAQAAVGPQLRDVEDVVRGRNSPHMAGYLAAWERHAGTVIEEKTFEVGWWHAVAHTRCTFGASYVLVAGDVEASLEAIEEGSTALAALRVALVGAQDAGGG